MNRRFLFLDANIFLHYSFFTDIDWVNLSNASSVELMVPYTVISTLDKKKYESSDSAVKNRAKRVIARLESSFGREGHPELRENVRLCPLDQEPEIDYAKWGLNRESEDDRIIAEILSFRQRHPGSEIAVVSGDLGLKLKCNRHNIPLLQLPDSCRLPERPNTEARRIKELESKILDLQSMQAKLCLGFPSGRNFTELVVGSPQILSDDEIRQKIERKTEFLEQKLKQAVTVDPIRGYDTALIEKAAAKEYLNKYSSYLDRANEYAVYRSKIIDVEFVLKNDGSASAEDTDIHIDEPSRNADFFIVSDDYLKRAPEEPKLPERRERNQFRLVSELSSLRVPSMPPNITGPIITFARSGYKVHFHVQRIKQGTHVTLGNIYLVFPIIKATSFGLKYVLNSQSLPSNVTGDLHIRITHSTK